MKINSKISILTSTIRKRDRENQFTVRKILKSVLILDVIISLIFFINVSMTYAIIASSSEQYQGIDVSNWQGYIDYSQVKADGIDIVYIKASQGSNIKDAYFDINYENAKANGLKVGFYHFLTATTTRRSRARSNFFCICNIWKDTRL